MYWLRSLRYADVTFTLGRFIKGFSVSQHHNIDALRVALKRLHQTRLHRPHQNNIHPHLHLQRSRKRYACFAKQQPSRYRQKFLGTTYKPFPGTRMRFALDKNCWVCAKWLLHSTLLVAIPVSSRNGIKCSFNFAHTQQFLSNAKRTLPGTLYLEIPVHAIIIFVMWYHCMYSPYVSQCQSVLFFLREK